MSQLLGQDPANRPHLKDKEQPSKDGETDG